MCALDFGDGVTMSEALSTSNTAELGLWSRQYLSSCHDKVTAQSKEDQAGAKAATTVSTGMTLQHLFFNYRNTISEKLTTTARLRKPSLRAMLSGNMTKHTDLRRNIDVLATRGNVERCSPVRIAEREFMRTKVEIHSHSSSLGDSMSSTATAPPN